MSWLKIDDQFAEHPKIIGLSDAAFRLHVRALCYAARNLTDGLIPAAWVIKSQTKAAVQLVFRGVWDALDEGGYQIHDYLTYQQSRAHVQGQRSQAVNRMQMARSRNVRANKDGTSDEVPKKFASLDLDPIKKEIQKETDPTTSRSQSQTRSSSPLILSSIEYQRLEKANKYVGSRLRIPHVLHADLRVKLGGHDPDGRLMEWYDELNTELEQSGDPIPDVFQLIWPRFKTWAADAVASAELERFRPKGA